MPGARRARLTPAPGTIAEPAADALPTADDERAGGAVTSGGAETSGPNDDRLRRDVPPHY